MYGDAMLAVVGEMLDESDRLHAQVMREILGLPEPPESLTPPDCDLSLAVADHGLRFLEVETRVDRAERSISELWLYRTETEWDERGWGNN